jgi:hypothetical protein
MRDGMPGPGWWIASDGNWYPPELHPDVRAAAITTAPSAAESAISEPVAAAGSAATAVDEPLTRLPFTPPANEPSPFEPLHVNGTANGTAATIEGATRNGAAPVEVATVTAPAPDVEADVVEAPAAEATIAPPDQARSPRAGRRAYTISLALLVMAVIVLIAQGSDSRPSLEQAVTTTVATNSSTAPTTGPAAANGNPSASPSTTANTGAASSTTRAGATTTPTVAGARVTPRIVSVFDLVKGNCLDGASLTDGLVTTIRVVDCAEPHTHEVFYSGRYPEASFDSEKIASYANSTCLAQFTPYVGIDYARSRYQYLHIVPTQESWTRDNDRDVVCVAFEENATLTGSIANRAQ